VIVLGDFNEFEFVSTIADTLSSGLTNPVNDLPEDERYSFIFRGDSQQLDYILFSDALRPAEFDIVHVNVEFADTLHRASDHDPVLARFSVPGIP